MYAVRGFSDKIAPVVAPAAVRVLSIRNLVLSYTRYYYLIISYW